MKTEREIPPEDIAIEWVVGKVAGPVLHFDKTTANVTSRIASQTRWVLFRDYLGNPKLRPYSPECGQPWQDIPNIDLTPEELEKAEQNLKNDEDNGNGFNAKIRNDRKSHAASKIIWPIGYKPRICVR